MVSGKIAWANDLLNRKEVAELLTDYIDGADHVKVVNIDSPWGTGKTFFLTNWRAGLYESRAVVYFNAWENDFTGDPMISLIANIRDQLSDFLPRTAVVRNGLSDFLSKAGAAVVSAAPIVARGVIKKSLGVDPLELKEASESEADADGDYDSAAAVAEKFVERIIESNSERMMSIKRFKDSLSALVAIALEKTGKPVYIFIDELDRCRPTYAIELLERVKHIFDVENCKFIVASDTSQLVHSIRAVYGYGFESRGYLKRFFDLTYSFAEPEYREWVIVNVDFTSAKSMRFVRSSDKVPRVMRQGYVKVASNTFYDPDLSEGQLIFLLMARCFKVELRQLDRIKNTLSLVLSRSGMGNIHYFYAAYLCFLLLVDSELFNLFVGSDSSGKDRRDIREKYPSSESLYFIYDNGTVHEIAENYRMILSLNEDELYNFTARARPDYALELAEDRKMGRCKLVHYPHLVKFAVGID